MSELKKNTISPIGRDVVLNSKIEEEKKERIKADDALWKAIEEGGGGGAGFKLIDESVTPKKEYKLSLIIKEDNKCHLTAEEIEK